VSSANAAMIMVLAVVTVPVRNDPMVSMVCSTTCDPGLAPIANPAAHRAERPGRRRIAPPSDLVSLPVASVLAFSRRYSVTAYGCR
jgi:hypothetical protein